ncbi:MAG: hypothetical protein ACFB21_10455 [Opitutales bacterium]
MTIVSDDQITVLATEGSGEAFHTFVAEENDGENVSIFLIDNFDSEAFTLTDNGDGTATLDYTPDGSTVSDFMFDPTGDNEFQVQVRAVTPNFDIDFQTLTISVIADVVPVVTPGNITVTGASGQNGLFRIGDTVTVTWDNSSDGDGIPQNSGNFAISNVEVDFSDFLVGGPGSVVAEPQEENSDIWEASLLLENGSTDTTTASISVVATNSRGPSDPGTVDNLSVDNELRITPGNIIVTTTGSGATPTTYQPGDEVIVQWDNSADGDNNPDIVLVGFDIPAFGGAIAGGVLDEEMEGIYTVASPYRVDANTQPGETAVVVSAFDDAGNRVDVTDDLILTIETADINISDVMGGPVDEDQIVTASYFINLTTTPEGPVEILVTPSENLEISFDGLTFFANSASSSERTLTFADTTLQQVFVRGVPNGVEEGPRTSLISHVLTDTDDTDSYPVGFDIPSATVGISPDYPFLGASGASLTPEGSLSGVSIPNAPNRVLVVVTGGEGGGGSPGFPDQIFFDGTPLTRVASANSGISGTSVWILTNPAATTGTLTWMPSTINGMDAVAYYVLTGVDQVEPFIGSASQEVPVGSSAEGTFDNLPEGSILIDSLLTNNNIASELSYGEGQLEFFAADGIPGGATFATSIETSFVSGSQKQEIMWASDQRAGYLAVAFRNVSQSGGTPFQMWALDNGLLLDASFDGNPDGDDLPNGWEWVTGGNPLVRDSDGLLAERFEPGVGLIFEFTRVDATEATVEVDAHYGSTLTQIFDNTAPVGATSTADAGGGVSVNVVENGSAPDDVTVTIPFSGDFTFGVLEARPVAP